MCTTDPKFKIIGLNKVSNTVINQSPKIFYVCRSAEGPKDRLKIPYKTASGIFFTIENNGLIELDNSTYFSMAAKVEVLN